MSLPTLARTPRVGAVIVNWNSFDHLRRCLAALSAQETHFARVVVVDNDSIDAAENLDLASGPENLSYLRLPYNAGFARGNNLAFQALADCEWVALINPDAFLDRDWLLRMIEASVNHPGFSCFASRLVSANQPSILDGMGDAYHVSGLVWRHGHGRPLREIPAVEVFSPCAAAALYRREALLAVGGFDEDFFCYVEDVDCLVRLQGARPGGPARKAGRRQRACQDVAQAPGDPGASLGFHSRDLAGHR